MPRKILTIDCETDPFKKGRLSIRPFIWGVYDGETFSTFKRADDVKKMLEREKFVVYAHNGGKFDYHFLTEFLNPFEPIMVINSRIAKMRIGSCEFRDSWNILPMSQGNLIGKYAVDYDIMEEGQRDKPENAKEIYNRLKNDCVDLHTLVTSFINNYGHNLTLAGAAFKQWRKISGEKTPKTTPDFYKNLFPYYYGGRVQCFHLGEFNEPFEVFDMTSAYPFNMLKQHPYGDNFIVDSKLPSRDVEQCFITLKCQSRGAFPYRSQNGLYFPADGLVREFNITGHEFVTAEALGLLKNAQIKTVLKFSQSINFKQYVDYFFRLKQNAEERGDKILRNEAKLFLNGLYGKFAANPDHYHEYIITDPQFIQAAANEGYTFNSMLGKWALLKRKLPEEKQHFYNVATAASITGAQRAEMMKAIINVDYPIYCDTDSIACRAPRSLNIGSGLGQWKKELSCDYGAIAGKKLYTFHSDKGFKSASKGVHLTPQEIINISRGQEIESSNIAPTFSIQKEPYILTRKIKMKKELQFLDR
jgi:hypothetical protein